MNYGMLNKLARFRLFSFVYHQSIAGYFDKPAGYKSIFNAGQIRPECLFQIHVVNLARCQLAHHIGDALGGFFDQRLIFTFHHHAQ